MALAVLYLGSWGFAQAADAQETPALSDTLTPGFLVSDKPASPAAGPTPPVRQPGDEEVAADGGVVTLLRNWTFTDGPRRPTRFN